MYFTEVDLYRALFAAIKEAVDGDDDSSIDRIKGIVTLADALMSNKEQG